MRKQYVQTPRQALRYDRDGEYKPLPALASDPVAAPAAAAICGWSYQKFQRLAAKEIPHKKFSDLGNRLYHPEDVESYIKEMEPKRMND